MTAIPNPEKITVEEYLRLTETMEKRTELLDGEIVALASPTRTHQRICSHLHHDNERLKGTNVGKGEVYVWRAASLAVY